MVVSYYKCVFNQCPELESCSFKGFKDLVLYAKVGSVGRTGQKTRDTE